MIEEWWIEKDMKRSGSDLTEELSRNFPRSIEEYDEKSRSG
jgi:hypothetical protein